MTEPAEASDYDAMDHSEVNAAFVERLVELGAFGRVLDIGTGPGRIAIRLAHALADARIVGVDLSGPMLKLAEAHRRRAEPTVTGRIEFRRADAKALGFADDSFQTVCSNTLMHHLPDPVPFLAEARRVLRPEGVLLIRDLFRPEDEPTLERLVERHAAGANPQQRRLFADSLRAALTPQELRDAAETAGLSEARIVIDTDRHMSLQMAKGPAADKATC